MPNLGLKAFHILLQVGLIPKSGWFSPRWRPEEARFSRENEGFPQWSFHPDSTQHLKIGCPILIVVNASRLKARVYVCVAIAAFWDRALTVVLCFLHGFSAISAEPIL